MYLKFIFNPPRGKITRNDSIFDSATEASSCDSRSLQHATPPLHFNPQAHPNRRIGITGLPVPPLGHPPGIKNSTPKPRETILLNRNPHKGEVVSTLKDRRYLDICLIEAANKVLLSSMAF